MTALSRFRWPLIAAGVAALLWLAFGLTEADRLLGGLSSGLWIAAVLATAVAAVLTLDQLAALIFLRPALGREATGLQRLLVVLGLILVAGFAALSLLGFDLRTVLTTSAVLTAAAGLALQPTVSSLVSGLNVHLDAMLRIGDRIEHEGGEVTITAMNWRVTTGTRRDGAVVVITNARLAESPLAIRPREAPERLVFSAPAPAELPPAQVQALITDILLDLADVDAEREIAVSPQGVSARGGTIAYQVGAWLRPEADVGGVKGEALSRLWYAYQRRGVSLPRSRLPAPVRQDEPIDMPPDWRLLLYAPGERLIAPDWAEGRRILLLRGAARPGPIFGRSALDPAARLSEPLARQVAVTDLARELSASIGPYGEYAVWKAARQGGSLAALREEAARLIEDPEGRAAFLAHGEATARPTHGPGAVLQAMRDSVGVLVCGDGLRACSEVALTVGPPGAGERLTGSAA